MKRSKRLFSLLLAILVLLTSLGLTSLVSAFAASGDTVYLKGTSFSTPYCYMWTDNVGENAAWPGVAMTAVGDGVYSYTLNSDYANIIFNNGSGGTGNQTSDMPFPGGNQIYDWSTGGWDVYDLSSAEPSITISKKDGSSFKTDTMDVTVTVSNADSAYYTVDGGAKQSISGSATVTVGAGVAVGSTTTLTVSATNANGTVTQTATYTKKDASSSGGNGSDGSTAAALGGYYSTNPDGQVGKQASISIDGSISDWDSSMLIAQGVANDDPRVYKPSSMHEIAIDDYALYAAWDNSNLYLMWEMTNLQDCIAPADNFPLSQGNLWIYNLPVFLYFSTDPSIEGDGSTTTDATVWNSGITLDANIDTVVALSTNASNGPYVYKANDDGKIVYNDTVRSGIKIKWGNETLSSNLWGIDEGYGHYNNRTPGDTLEDSSKWLDFYTDPEHKESLDMFYEISIPLDLLGIDASYLESDGIGLMKVSTFGTSAMNTLPADPSTWNNADQDYSQDPTTSKEKEDEDHITVPLARIGKLLSGSSGGTTPAPKPTTPSTTPTTPDSGNTNPPVITPDNSGATDPAEPTPSVTPDTSDKTDSTDAPDGPVTTDPAESVPTVTPDNSTSTDPAETPDATDSTSAADPSGPVVIIPGPDRPTPPSDGPGTDDTTKPSGTTPDTNPDDGELLYGDSDRDGKINIKDATLIQKIAAMMVDIPSEEAAICADVNNDASINIKDATAIQKYVAGLDPGCNVGGKVSV